MKQNYISFRSILEWGLTLSAVGAWAAVLLLTWTDMRSHSVWAVFLIFLVAITVTVCAVIVRRMVFQPMDDLTEMVANWGSTAPEDLQKQIDQISGPMGDLGKVFYDRMNEVETRMAGLEKNVTEQTTQMVQAMVVEEICHTVLPQTLKDYPSRQYFEVAGLVSPGQRKYTTFYDYFYIDSGLLCIALGQVSYDGVDAALLMTATQTLIRSRIRLGRSVQETMNDVNAQLYDYGSKGEVRVLLATLDTAMGFFTFVNTGICKPMLMRNGERFETVESLISTPLRRNQNVSYRSEDLRLRQGDRLFLCTEGLETAESQAGSSFGEQALRDALNQSRTQKEPEDSLRHVAQEVAAFCPKDDAHDGYAALLLEYRKGEKELAHLRIPGTPDHASEVLDFMKSRLDENGIQRKHYARIAVLVDELFALCCRKQKDGGELDVECGVAPDAQSVTLRVTGSFQGKDPLEENEGPALQSADYIQNHGDYISFKPGDDQDSLSVVCFL